MISSSDFHDLIVSSFPFKLTEKQRDCAKKLSVFIFDNSKDLLFVLKGYAGTGKTTMIGSIIMNLSKTHMKSILLAPTGRAAKVMSQYSNHKSYTIHKYIYSPKTEKEGKISFILSKNNHKNTLFIVDEASMISNSNYKSFKFGTGALLDDLMKFVYSGTGCKLLLVGDTAQLPPVNLTMSPALDIENLEEYTKNIKEIELDEVVRQEKSSEILYNATKIRKLIDEGIFNKLKLKFSGINDIIKLEDSFEIMDAINDSYIKQGKEETMIIVRSNKRANLYNREIRDKILFNDSELSRGDFLMILRNNYFWLKPETEAGFIANGDIIEVLEIINFKDLYGFRFAEALIRLIDYPNIKPFEAVLMLDTIMIETPSLSNKSANELYIEVSKDYNHMSGYKKFLAIKQNKYLNALQVKFSYAITCHKSQGGQWKNIFIEQPYLPEGLNKEYFRWFYTAITRAKEKLFLVGFEDEFFD